MNETISTLLDHRSVRSFLDTPVTEEQLQAIVTAGQMASTSSNVQAYSVIAVTEPSLKRQLAILSGDQAYVEQCPLFLVWCADLYRVCRTAGMYLSDQTTYEDSTESFMVATVDTALAAQNAAVAAESMGLGICYIGGIRNRIAEVSELLRIPELAYPVFGMCVGVPDRKSGQRPRLPTEAVLHRNGYDPEMSLEAVKGYDVTMVRYLRERTEGRKSTPWSKIMAEWLARPNRLHMRAFLEDKGLLRK
ncbi:oxygen-insensitive NADPH nitroreductase [Cohnella nanjingensis]|uniref:Oxygen-insensitive NADPH nitroreductase n=1 Tax=Cohnella nanjingensis TaxID=1387779 RepID=A0A7X0RNS5_9BACL|nr:oxygen-insensitive NADPH nitroreductase [Cohnella nanjingensis]MBB6669751.1 oxygen-insensitive NADPH nitroreductase [Cohnella nanjingensis]